MDDLAIWALFFLAIGGLLVWCMRPLYYRRLRSRPKGIGVRTATMERGSSHLRQVPDRKNTDWEKPFGSKTENDSSGSSSA